MRISAAREFTNYGAFISVQDQAQTRPLVLTFDLQKLSFITLRSCKIDPGIKILASITPLPVILTLAKPLVNLP